MPGPAGVTIKQYAAIRDVTEETITNADARGIISWFRNGLINPTESDRNWEREGLAFGRGRPRKKKEDPLTALIGRAKVSDPTHIDDPSAFYSQQRAAHEKAKREIAELKLAEMRADLVDVNIIGRVWFEVLRKLRNRLLAIPNRVSAGFAANSDAGEIRQRLADEIEEALAIAPEDPPNVGESNDD